MRLPQLSVVALRACILKYVVNSSGPGNVSVGPVNVDMLGVEVSGPRRVSAVAAAIRLGPEPPDDVKRIFTPQRTSCWNCIGSANGSIPPRTEQQMVS